MVVNAKALGQSLTAEGFGMLAADRGFTETHQIFALIPAARGSVFERRCQASGLLVTKAQRMLGDRVAVRLTTQEITRLGMAEGDMPRIAHLLRRAILDDESTASISRDVGALLEQFPDVRYSFDADR
jgi:glycine hydroxymethyltransferase